jgi:hypothetical protein
MWEIIIVACISYGIWLVGDRIYRWLRPKKKTLPKKPKRHLTAEQLLGKCRYEVGHSKTNVPTYPKTEQPMDKGHIFAADNKTESSEPLPVEGSDEEFSKLEIPDVPLEFEQTGDDHSHLGEEEEEFIPAADGTVEFAQGLDAGALMELLSIIGCTDTTVEQEQKAGELLSRMGENDITEKLRSEPKRAMRIDELVCTYYAKLPKVRITEENPFAVPTAEAGDFSIENFINRKK